MPGVGFAEQIIFDLRRPKLGIHVRLVFAEKTTVLGFDSNDSIHSNQITNRMATWLSQKDGPLTFILSQKGRGESHDAIRRTKTKERRLGQPSTNDGWEAVTP